MTSDFMDHLSGLIRDLEAAILRLRAENESLLTQLSAEQSAGARLLASESASSAETINRLSAENEALRARVAELATEFSEGQVVSCWQTGTPGTVKRIIRSVSY